MKIIISALHFPWDSIDRCLSRLRQDPVLDGVEFSLHERFERPHCTRQDLAALARLEPRGGPALSAHVWDNLPALGPADGRRALLRWLEVCRGTRIKEIVMHGGTWPDQREGLVRLREVLEAVLPRFEEAGVTILLENHYAYTYRNGMELLSEPWEFRQILSLDSPSLKFCFDTGHGHMTRNSEALVRELAPWLTYVHLADNQGEHDDHDMFRRGTVDWHSLFKTLRQIGFDGTFCVEFPVREDREPFCSCVEEIRTRWC